MRCLAVIAILLAATACTPEAENQAAPDPQVLSEKGECARDAASQIACLVEAFEATACADADAVSMMRRTDGESGAVQMTTAYAAPPACYDAVAARAEERGFALDTASSNKEVNETPGQDQLALTRPDGGHETLILGAHGLIEWERTQ